MKLNPPWFPDYYVEVSDTGPGAFIQNATDVRLTFRVRNEDLEDVLRTLYGDKELPPFMKGITSGA
ncbi:hypothetical protein KIV66_gp39 [Mycobacterium phage MyraDee]|uniref:Uncharacterized protein n=1 Tax=Mycobacterium phage MyraDee TaxID=2024303 RepID=A0A222YZM5_9CAUD|nr:hypothetical protein KIV66_gp39 [Mycobacterium phage MyraDee]ASR77147.1 hypothetical protein SEA_MYRADEE_39 [Mycobacterium phage MyraDee]